MFTQFARFSRFSQFCLVAVLAVSFSLSASFGASTTALASDDVIRLGVPGAHTGDLAGYGIPALNAARLVVDEYNANGGILGKQIEIVAIDDQCRPDLSTNAANKAISEGLTIIMGHTCSGPTKAVMPRYTEKKIVVVSPSATSPDLTQSGKFPYFFRTTPSDDAQARLGADFAIQQLKAQKIAILHDKGDYGKGYAEFIRQFVKEDGRAKVVFFEGITPGAVDYSSVIQKIQRTGADALIFGGYYPEASKLVALIKQRNMEINFISEDGVRTQSFIELAGENAEGVYASSSKDVSELELTKKAFADHLAKFNSQPGQFFEQACAATKALLNAVEKAGTVTDTDAIAKALRTEYVETTLGNIRFDEKGDMEGAGFAMYRVTDGAFKDQNFTPEQ